MTVGSKVPLSLGSKISKFTVVLIVLANLNCEIVDMIWLHSILQLIIINIPLFFIKIATFIFLFGLRFYVPVM